MCAIAGFLGAANSLAEQRSILDSMGAALSHRGPDGHGTWFEPGAGLALAHRRLAILDLSPAGSQPMTSAGGRFTVTYNGEIYNYRELRRSLESDHGVSFRSQSDTEVLLAGLEAWGLERTLDRSIGMFAFALWDAKDHGLHLVRDRMGVKPLYYGWAGRAFLFASELGGLLAHPEFDATLDRNALMGYLGSGYFAAPATVCHYARKVEPGTIVTVRPEDPRRLGFRVYWNPRELAARSLSEAWTGTAEEAVEALEERVKEAVRLRLVSDVPLGAFLSGGVDSSTVVAAMRDMAGEGVKTFALGHHDPEHDESNHARAVAEQLGTEHTEAIVEPAELQEALRSFPLLLSEPLADASLVPTWLLSRLARRRVTVALSGDGGDELFAGYNRYLWGMKSWELRRRLPAPVRETAARILAGVAPQTWDRWAGAAHRFFPGVSPVPRTGEKLHKLSALLRATSETSLVGDALVHWAKPHRILGGMEGGGRDPLTSPEISSLRLLERLMLRDLLVYLPDDVLSKVDRASMAVGLEVRVPLLDHRVVELAWRFPRELKIRNGQSKWILKEVLARRVPRSVWERPKMGFSVPLGRWLRGPLRDWAEGLLDPVRLGREGVFEVDPIRSAWAQHLTGRQDRGEALWDVLMFQLWLDTWGKGARASFPRAAGSWSPPAVLGPEGSSVQGRFAVSHRGSSSRRTTQQGH